jgi:hypothetical protein
MEGQIACVYDWFVRGWTMEEIALMTGQGITLINYYIAFYEQDHKYGENSLPIIRETAAPK